MNYRHAFHAGNFADVVKHILLTRILTYLTRKPAPLRYIDTHAGLGRYDLSSPEAQRTGEWRAGIARLLAAPRPPAIEALLQPYLTALDLVAPDTSPESYPGSPALAQSLLRDGDRLLLAELHPEDATALRRRLGSDKRVKVLDRDGYDVLNAALPPPERRGLVLIDPPFEQPAEFDRLTDAVVHACRKWATGTYAIWYPIKPGSPPLRFFQALEDASMPPACRLELRRETSAPNSSALQGTGLFVINPPYVLAEEARQLMPFLAEALGSPEEAPFITRIEERAGHR